ncbi:MAG: serine/threonine-protein kinase, partial [Planctomycetota bacterium]
MRCPLCEIAEEAAQDSLAAGGVDVSQLDASQTHDEEPLALDDADEDGTVLFDSEVELGSATAASAGDAGAGGTDVVASSDDADTDFELDLDAGDGPDLDDGFGAGGSGQQRDGGATHAEAPIEDDDRRPTLHGGAEERPATHAGAASLTRFDQVTPAPPVDSKAAATVELEQKIKQIWDGAQSQGSHPSATLQVTASHLEDDTHLSVSARPIAYPEAEPGDKADYRVVEFVNQGGMGRVYKAQQTSLGRQVAIKTLKDDLAKKDRHRRKFFAEASITGRLDHPNIVPIYDLGIRGDGVPFYSMKFVTGQPWDDRIGKMSKAENVRTLLDVCDAMAFAHSRQILHRDLKPENVMLGEYGEVLVADWGLAIHMERDREFNLGGTPLYMAPEMANHDVPLIGVRSDVYLLGAILFEVLEGKPPHSASGKTVTERLLTAAMNTIEPHRSSDELIEVALKALATNPSDRYATVQEFQAAIVECQRHAESRDRSERAATELAAARATGENEKYARALFAYQDAIDLWPENHAAAEGLQETRIAYAQNALAERDYALGLSLLDESDPDHQPIYKKLLAAQAEENARGRRLKVARNAAIGATVATLLVLGVSAVWINKERGVA